MPVQYALELPVQPTGGPEHITKALSGQRVSPANYTFKASDGTGIVYHVCGQGETLIVGIAPGWGVGINYLPTLLKPLVDSGKMTLVAIQPRGSLPSDRPDDATRMTSKHMAADMEDFRNLLGYPTLNVLGHSNGAAICLAYAELFPSSCAKAVLIETQLIGYSAFVQEIMDGVQTRTDDPRYTEAVVAFHKWFGKAQETDQEATDGTMEMFALYFYDPVTGVPAFAEQTGPLVVQAWARTHQYAVDDLPEASLVDDLDKVTADVLLISGEDDFIVSVASSKVAKEAIGDKAKHVVYPNCGHMPWLESKERFFSDVSQFLFE